MARVVRPKGRYEYTGKLNDPFYFRVLCGKVVGLSPMGITSYPDRFIIWFERELTSEEKSKLDGLVTENPVPVSTYEISPITLDDVEREIGVRPVTLMIDPTTGTATCHFDTTLTLEQEAKLEALLRSPMKFKRRKP